MKEDLREKYRLEEQIPHKIQGPANGSLYIKAQAYFVRLREQNEKLIQNSIKKFKSSKDFTDLADALILVQGPLEFYEVPHLRARSVFLMGTLFGSAIHYELQNMSLKERTRYSRIHRQSLQLILQARQKLDKHHIDCEIMSLMCQDFLSLMLLEGQLYQKFCSSRIPLFFTDDIALLFPSFKAEYIIKIGKYFEKNQSYITFEGLSQQIVQLVKLLTIIILRFRVISIALKTPDHVFLNPLSFALLKDISSHQRIELLTKSTSNQYEYYLSEISFFMYLDETTAIPSTWKLGIINLLSEVAKKQTIEEKRYLILKTKIKYNLSFGNLLRYLKILENNGEIQALIMITDAKRTKQNYWRLYQALPYIFLMNDSTEAAFQKLGFNKQFNITHGSEGVMNCSSYVKSVILNSISFRGAEYGLQTLKQLRLQRKKAKIIVIKKYEFTYNEMRSYFTEQLTDKDIPITLILGTVDKHFLFYQLFFCPLQQNAFITCLLTQLRRINLSYNFVISIHAYHDYNSLSRGSLAALLQLAKKLKTRVYVSNVFEECSFNTMLFSFLYSKMIRKSLYPQDTFIENYSREFQNLVYRLTKYQEKMVQSPKKFEKN